MRGYFRKFTHRWCQYFSEVDRSDGVCKIAVNYIDMLERDDVKGTTDRIKQEVDLVFGPVSEGDVSAEPPSKKARQLQAYPSDTSVKRT